MVIMYVPELPNIVRVTKQQGITDALYNVCSKMIININDDLLEQVCFTNINDDLVEQVCFTTYIGVTVNSTLSWDNQYDNLCCKLADKIAVLCKIRSFVKYETLKLVYMRKQFNLQWVMLVRVMSHKKSNLNTLSMFEIMLLAYRRFWLP